MQPNQTLLFIFPLPQLKQELATTNPGSSFAGTAAPASSAAAAPPPSTAAAGQQQQPGESSGSTAANPAVDSKEGITTVKEEVQGSPIKAEPGSEYMLDCLLFN